MDIDIHRQLIKKQKHLESRLRKLRKIEVRIMKKLITLKSVWIKIPKRLKKRELFRYSLKERTLKNKF